MEGFTVKEEHEDNPIPLPGIYFQPQVFEIKVELEDDSIKQEEESLLKVEEPQEEDSLLKEEELLPKITAVSGNHGGAQAAHIETEPDQTGKRKADETAGPASKSPKPSEVAVAEEDSYDCTFCGEKFARKPRLSKHILAAHLDELLVKCPQCDAEFGSKRALANHQKFHTGEKYFCCGRCGEAFKYVSNYVSHMNDHMGAQPYECGECGAGFSTKRKANLHVDTHHSTFWPYKCETCLKPFLEKKKFLRHQKNRCVKRENGPGASNA